MTAWAVDPVGGNCGATGSNVTWTLSDENGDETLETLTISGTGEMEDYNDPSKLPWCDYLTAIKTVIINDGVSNIGMIAFGTCINLTSVSIPASVIAIYPAAFYGCSSLTSVSIPASVVSIGFQAFQGCSSLESITIPASVKEIQYGAFMDCSNLASVSIEDGVEAIQIYAFSGCSCLASFNIPASVKNISADAFSGTKWYTDHADGLLYKDNWLLGYKGDVSGELSIENGTKGIAAEAFSGCTGLTSVSVPASVTSISTQAFYGCSGLTSVSIGDGVMSIEAGAFYGCSSLASFSIPASVTEIGQNAFTNTKWYSDHADGLLYQDNWLLGYKGSKPTGELSIETGTRGIAVRSFSDCTGLTSILIPGSVMTIGANVFRGCSGLTSVSIGDGVKRIENNAFSGCTALASFSIPASVTTIGENAFNSTGWYNSHADGALYQDNWLLEYKGSKPTGDVSIENGTRGIAGEVFYACTGLTSVSIPASVTTIGDGAFSICPSLTSIILNSNPFIDRDALYFTPATVTMNLTGNKGETGEYWTTFYNENYNFQVPAEGTQVFKAALSGSTLALTELTTDKIITKNNAVILKSTSSPVVQTLTTTDSSNDFSGNDLQGVSDSAGETTDGTFYVLNKGSQGVGFYKLADEKKVGVGKAYLTYSGGGAPSFLGFDETTSLSEELRVKNEEFATAPVYNLAGQRVAHPTKGLYIVNGKKVIMK